MKKKAFISCSRKIAPQYLVKLNDIFDLSIGDCLSSENEIIKNVKGASGYIFGGNEFMTTKIMNSADFEWHVFVGNHPQTFYSQEAWQVREERKIPVYATGGGLRAVAQTTYDEIVTGFLMRDRLSRKFSDIPSEPDDLLRSHKIAVIGAGQIGSMLLKMLKEKTDNLVYADAMGEKEDLKQLGIDYVELINAFESDIVSLHVAYIPNVTENMIIVDHLDKIKERGLFINNARAQIVEPNGYYNFLMGREDVTNIWDVFYKEGDDLKSELTKSKSSVFKDIFISPNFYFTGHSAAEKPETYVEYGKELLELIEKYKLANK